MAVAIYIMKGERGYRSWSQSSSDPAENRQMVNEQNQSMGVTRQQEEAMLAGSLFGWNMPAAKPWNYELDGKSRPLLPKERDYDER